MKVVTGRGYQMWLVETRPGRGTNVTKWQSTFKNNSIVENNKTASGI